MESIANYLFSHAAYAHFIIFALLMLAGWNIPISEDVMVILSGVLAATVVPDQTLTLFTWTFLGAYLSDWESYWIGSRLGPKLVRSKWFGGFLSPQRLQLVHQYYAKYGSLTLLFGRFIPFGVRNCLFMAAGMGRMPFLKFIFIDALACLTTCSTLFTLSYWFGKQYGELLGYLKFWNFFVFGLFLASLFLIWGLIRKRRQPLLSPYEQ